MTEAKETKFLVSCNSVYTDNHWITIYVECPENDNSNRDYLNKLITKGQKAVDTVDSLHEYFDQWKDSNGRA